MDVLRDPTCVYGAGCKRLPTPLPVMNRESDERSAYVRRNWAMERLWDHLPTERCMVTEDS